MTLRESVDRTVGALALPEREAEVSAALVALARRYASEIDGAAAAAAQARRLVADVQREQGPDSALAERVEALAAQVSERAALRELGKLLHAALADLQATPKSRGLKVAPQTGPSPLARLRAVSGGAS